MNAIPSVNLEDFISDNPERKSKFIQDIGGAFENIGFVALSGHFLSDELVQQLYDEIKSSLLYLNLVRILMKFWV